MVKVLGRFLELPRNLPRTSGSAPAEPLADPLVAWRTWSGVVAHLSGSRNLQLGLLWSFDSDHRLLLERLQAADVLVRDVGRRRDESRRQAQVQGVRV